MRKCTILYVEDEQWHMGGIVDSLRVHYNVLTARNADEALSILEKAKDVVDLILLDIIMPSGQLVPDPNRGRTAGVSFARLFFLEKIKPNIPIVCYTVVDDRKVIDELKSMGVKEVVSKRELPSELERIIRKYLPHCSHTNSGGGKDETT